LVGWIRADNVPSAEVTNELARLSNENRELRSQLSSQRGEFNGLAFDELIKILRNDKVPEESRGLVATLPNAGGVPHEVQEIYFNNYYQEIKHQGDVFEVLSIPLATQPVERSDIIYKLVDRFHFRDPPDYNEGDHPSWGRSEATKRS